ECRLRTRRSAPVLCADRARWARTSRVPGMLSLAARGGSSSDVHRWRTHRDGVRRACFDHHVAFPGRGKTAHRPPDAPYPHPAPARPAPAPPAPGDVRLPPVEGGPNLLPRAGPPHRLPRDHHGGTPGARTERRSVTRHITQACGWLSHISSPSVDVHQRPANG